MKNFEESIDEELDKQKRSCLIHDREQHPEPIDGCFYCEIRAHLIATGTYWTE